MGGQGKRAGERLAPVRERLLDERTDRGLGRQAQRLERGARRSSTSTESTFGTGKNTVRETGRTTLTSHASWASTLGTPYAAVPGEAARRSPTSRCTIATQRLTLGNSAIVRRLAVAAMP